MNGKDIIEGMSYVDERFVDEAEIKTLPKRIAVPWIKVASVAACLCLIVFGLYNLQSYLRGETVGMSNEGAADPMPGGIAEDKLDSETQEAVSSTSSYGIVGEVPAVILYVENMTNLGFVGTVAQLVDTDIFEVGMELNVVVTDGTRHEIVYGNSTVSTDSKTDYAGFYVLVQFIEYDRETGTIVVNMIQKADAPETTP